MGVPLVGKRIVAVGFVVRRAEPPRCFVTTVDDDFVVVNGRSIRRKAVCCVGQLRPCVREGVVGFGQI